MIHLLKILIYNQFLIRFIYKKNSLKFYKVFKKNEKDKVKTNERNQSS